MVAAMLLAMTQSVRAAGHLMPAAQDTGSLDPLAPTAGVTCTLTTSQTVGTPTNTSFSSALLLSPAGNLSLVPYEGVPPGNSVDVLSLDNYFFLNIFTGNSVTINAAPSNQSAGNYNLGIDVYDASFNLIASDTNTSDFSAVISLLAPFSGQMYVRIYQLNAAARCTGGTYSLAFSNNTPTPTPSLTPTQTRTPTPTRTITPTPGPFACTTGSDKFEPNNDYDTATTIGLGVKYDGLTFVECIQSDDSWDNDFFKVRVKPGMLVTCRTLSLSAGTDTNLILYDVNLNGITGQDDFNRAAGDLSSSVSYYSTFEGWLYGLVGEGFHRPQSEQAGASYSYECTIVSQFTPTPAPTATDIPGQPTRTPIPTLTPTTPPTLTPSPTLSPTPPFIKIVPLPTVTPAGLPGKAIPVSLEVYYDADGNNKPDPGEGVVGVSARVFDLTNGNLLAQGLTDQTGRVNFTVTAAGAVQLVVPYFNFSRIILPESGGAVTIRISPHELPRSIP
jgi:hypothetical protein